MADQDIYVINMPMAISAASTPVTGTPRWTVATQGGRLASISATKLYLRSYNLDLFVDRPRDRSDGRRPIRDSPPCRVESPRLRPRISSIGSMTGCIFATSSGMILALREIGQTPPRPLRDPKLLPFGYIPPEGLKLRSQGRLRPQRRAGAAPAEDQAAAPKEEPGKPDSVKSLNQEADLASRRIRASRADGPNR